MSTAALRAALFLALWLAVNGSFVPGDVAVGVVASVLATLASVHLLPPASARLRLVVLLRELPYFLRHALVAGFDVARRVLGRRVDVDPGFVTYSTALPPGIARNTFATIASLVPGTLPCGEREDGLDVHCLDRKQPVAAELAADERRYGQVVARGAQHD